MSSPLMKVTPARTRATTRGRSPRQRSCADSISLNAMASPAAREPEPLVTFVLFLTVAKADHEPCLAGRRAP